MHPALYNVVEGLVGGLAIIGTVFAAVAGLRTKLPQATINIQNDAIAALERQNGILKDNLAEIQKLVVELKARVEIIETLPLKNIATSLEEIKQIGHTNQALVQALAGGSNTTIVRS